MVVFMVVFMVVCTLVFIHKGEVVAKRRRRFHEN